MLGNENAYTQDPGTVLGTSINEKDLRVTISADAILRLIRRYITYKGT